MANDMADVGTRMDHLNDLKDLWEHALNLLNVREPRYLSANEKATQVRLMHALELLNDHLTKDYVEWRYRAAVNDIGRNGPNG